MCTLLVAPIRLVLFNQAIRNRQGRDAYGIHLGTLQTHLSFTLGSDFSVGGSLLLSAFNGSAAHLTSFVLVCFFCFVAVASLLGQAG
ncbi:hypothetical protein Q0O45_13150, partial [Staphylococcus aureus]|nr:hypothetical protein [Staphylococcus aureus]